MDVSHDWVVAFSKSFGLLYLIALSVGITVYAFWPSLGRRFDRAARSVLDDEEGPIAPRVRSADASGEDQPWR